MDKGVTECPWKCHRVRKGQDLNNPLEPSIRRLLEAVRTGEISPEQAFDKLAFFPSEDSGFARLDHQRTLRQGFPEAVFCTGKRPEQVVELVGKLGARGVPAVATRVSDSLGTLLETTYDRGRYYTEAGLFVLLPETYRKPEGIPELVVATAGTADQRVAEEAAHTALAYGVGVARLYDVGVAGLHRLLSEADVIRSARVIIVAAGMDGALPSVVSGLVSAPVIAVPTSIGYGASFGGVAALLAMLNTCAPGVVTVNIDNGYGAAVAACKMLRDRNDASPS